MAVDAGAVAAYLRVPEDKVPALDRVVSAVLAHAAKRYTEPTDPDELAQWEQALTMQAARLAMRHQSITTGTTSEGAPIVVHRFDPDVRDLLSDFLIVAGLFGRDTSGDEAP